MKRNFSKKYWMCGSCVFLFLKLVLFPCMVVVSVSLILHLLQLAYGQVDSTEFVELAESVENHNLLFSLIKQPRIIPKLILIPFHRFFQSKIIRILFSSNSAFLFVALYLKTKTRIPRKEL